MVERNLVEQGALRRQAARVEERLEAVGMAWGAAATGARLPSDGSCARGMNAQNAPSAVANRAPSAVTDRATHRGSNDVRARVREARACDAAERLVPILEAIAGNGPKPAVRV